MFKMRDKATMMTLYKSLVRSHLEYCCPLWNCSKNKDIQQLERIQRTFTLKIDGIQHLNYWQRLKALNLMSLQRRRERYLIIHMWKVLHCKCPNDIGIQFSVTLKSSSQCNQALHDNSFEVTGPRLWNVIQTYRVGQKSVPIRWVLYHRRVLYLRVISVPTCSRILSLKFENSIFWGHTQSTLTCLYSCL